MTVKKSSDQKKKRKADPDDPRRARVLADARRRYREFTGRAWEDDQELVRARVHGLIERHAGTVQPGNATSAEKDARHIVEELRQVHAKLSAFVAAMPESDEPCTRYLLAWRQRLGYRRTDDGSMRQRYDGTLDPAALTIVSDAAFPEPPAHAGFTGEALSAFVSTWTSKDLTGTGKVPSAAVLASIWLLCDQWPAGVRASATPVQVFASMRDAVKKARGRL